MATRSKAKPAQESQQTVTAEPAQIDLAGRVKAAIKYTLDRCTPAEGAHTDKPHSAVSTSEERKSASANGDYSASSANGKHCAAMSAGRFGKARGKTGCALFLVHRDDNWQITHAKALIVGQDGIKPDTFYRLNESGDAVEVK